MNELIFDLTTEPWIPCERQDGSVVELSTREALARAHELRSVQESSPLESVALHRHLLAVLHRAYAGPRSMQEWVALYRSGAFDAARVDSYLDSVRDRMDLFHPERPFAQVRGLSKKFDADPVDMMTVERRSWGTARALFQHRPEGHRPVMRPGEAARALLAYQAFDTGGLVKKKGEPTSASAAPLTSCAVVLVRGATLFETLVSSLLRYDPAQALPVPGTEDDAPSWEREPQPESLPLAKEPKELPLGWLDQLTWLSRRIELVREGSEVVGFVRCVGKGMAEEAELDPMVAWREVEKVGWRPLAIRADRAFWRDSHVLFEASSRTQQPGTNSHIRPKALDQLGRKEALSVVPEQRKFCLEVGGIATSKSRVDLVRREALPTMASVLADPDAGESVRKALDFAEAAVWSVREALRYYAELALAPGGRKPDPKDVRAQVDALGATAAAWSALGASFQTFLQQLQSDADGAAIAFENECMRVGRTSFESATASGEQSPRWLRARAKAEQKLHRGLASLDRTRADKESA